MTPLKIEMAATRTILWVDSLNNRLIGGWNALVWAGKQAFNQGDVLSVTIRQVRKPSNLDAGMEEIPIDLSGDTTLSIGNAAARPLDGKWSVTFGSSTTELMPFDISAQDLGNRLNSLPSIGVAGGVYVDKSNDDTFKVSFLTTGARSAPTAAGDSLIPQSTVDVRTVNAGGVSSRAVFTLTQRQTPVAKTTSWAAEDACEASITALSPTLSVLAFDTPPKDGFLTLAIGDGEPFRFSVYDSGNTLQNALGTGFVVSKGGDYRWVIESPTDTPSGLAIVSQDNVLSFSGITGLVDLSTPACVEFLSGATSVDTTLEITTSKSGVTTTLLRNTCTVTSKIAR